MRFKDLIPPALWPPNSPELNPVDYTVWSVLQERVYRTKISDVDELKRRIISEWAALSHTVIDSAVTMPILSKSIVKNPAHKYNCVTVRLLA